jgi:hypothetical protein
MLCQKMYKSMCQFTQHVEIHLVLIHAVYNEYVPFLATIPN